MKTAIFEPSMSAGRMRTLRENRGIKNKTRIGFSDGTLRKRIGGLMRMMENTDE